MKRIPVILLALALTFSLCLAAQAESVDTAMWQEEFNSMWAFVIPTAFVFDETPMEGTIISGKMGDSFALTVTPSEEEEGKLEVKAEIFNAAEADGDVVDTVITEGEEAPEAEAVEAEAGDEAEGDDEAEAEGEGLFDLEKTYALIALNAAIKAQRPDLLENDEAINTLSMAISKEIFLSTGYETTYDGTEKVLAFEEEGIVYKEYISSEEEVMWFMLVL